MSVLLRLACLAAALSLTLAAGCDRNTEPFVPGEKPRPPDLSRIFPATDEDGRPIPFPKQAGLQESSAMPPAAAAAAPSAASSEGPISGTVRVTPELAAQVPSGAILFIIARRTDMAAGPPLAVKRVADPSFPVSFRVGQDDVMVPAFKFSGDIRLEARLDQDGNAISRTPGDLAGQAPGTYTPGASDVTIVLDHRL